MSDTKIKIDDPGIPVAVEDGEVALILARRAADGAFKAITQWVDPATTMAQLAFVISGSLSITLIRISESMSEVVSRKGKDTKQECAAQMAADLYRTIGLHIEGHFNLDDKALNR